MKKTLSILAATFVISGCTGKIEKQLETLTSDQQTFVSRLEALEQENRQLRDALAESNAKAAQAPAPAAPAPVVVASDDTTSAAANALADRINALVQSKVDATIDQQIAARIGSQDDIEAIFSEVVGDELDHRDEQERLEREQRRRDQTAERDKRDIARKSEAAGLDDEKQEAVNVAMQEMRGRLHEQLPELKEQEAELQEMLAVVKESRELFEEELLDTLSEDELQAYYEADGWYQRQQSKVAAIGEAASLDAEQGLLVDEAYSSMRESFGDGYTLMSEGYAGHSDMHQNMNSSRETFTTSLQTIMTPEQFEAYEASDASSHGRRGRRGSGPRL